MNGYECGSGPKLPRFDLKKHRALGGSPWARHSVQSYIFMEQRFSGLQQRKNLLTQSLMLLMLRLLLVFFYILTIRTPRNIMDKGCENLAASIGSTMLQESG